MSRWPSRLMMPAMPHISRSSCGSQDWPLREHLQVLVALPVGHGGEVALPFVALVVVEDLVEPAGQRASHHFVLRKLVERGAEAVGPALERCVTVLREEVVGVLR